jgi:dihydrofolate synthase/folylpolyglutamate synthase
VTAREYLFALEQFGVKLGLEQIRSLLDRLARPDRAFPSILVAGTNGKGSVTAILERGLRASGYRTGRYTSPHLTAIEERIAIDGAPVAPRDFDEIAEDVRAAAQALPSPPTFFEATTALAIEAFRRAGVEAAVFEVGLGGRLDATNVLSAIGVAITAVDFDHEAHLGYTLEAIAREKAGIIKPGRFCVLGDNPPIVRQVVEQACCERDARLVDAPAGVTTDARFVNGVTRLSIRTPDTDYGELTLGLRGRHQIQNAVTAVRALEAAGRDAWPAITRGAIRTALQDVNWPARLELRQSLLGPVLIDGAHNPGGARALAAYLDEAYGRRLPCVFGAMKDKRIDDMVRALSGSVSPLICTAPQSPRAATSAEVAAIARAVAPSLDVIERPAPFDALSLALSLGAPAIVAGSLYLAGEIRDGLA